jgi:hypothetical protein
MRKERLERLDRLNDAEWQHDLAVSDNKIGDVLIARGDRPRALFAYRKSFAIVEASAARDPHNVQTQTDVVVACAKLGTLEHGQTAETRRNYLIRGRSILLNLKLKWQPVPGQDGTEWFEEQLRQLPPGDP